MALDVLPDNGIIVKTRDEFVSLWLRCFKIRNPAASIAQDTQPFIDASVMADILAPMSFNARTIGRSIPLSEVSGSRLDQRLKECGLPERFPETGSQGSVIAVTSATGATIEAGVEATDLNNGLRFKCASTAHYQNGDYVPLVAIDTGTQTNLPAGTVFVWSQGIPGLFATCTAVQQTDGSGFSGGRAAESDDEVRDRISSALANPASAGNDAEYQRLVENSRGHGISVQKCFTYAGINGPGTNGVAFTMKPAVVGGSRLPNSTQIAAVKAYVVGQLPADDTYLSVTLLAQPVDLVFDVSWTKGAAGWADPNPWPPRVATGAGAWVVTAAASPVSFTIGTDNAVYGSQGPTAGMSIAVFDGTSTGTFRLKRLATVTGSGPYVCTVDTTNGASDTTFIPVVGKRVCPWSKSLATLIPPVAAYFDTLGPGEQLVSFFDPGLRQRRNPVPPKDWPNTISSRIETNLLSTDSVNDVRTQEGLGVTTGVGIPGALSYLMELGTISAFPL